MNLDHLRHQFGSGFDAAQLLVDRGMASISGRSVDGKKLFGIVREKNRNYRLLLEAPKNKQTQAKGECGCRKTDCVHLCALLIHYLTESPSPAQTPAQSAALDLSDRRQLIYSLSPEHQRLRCRPQLILVNPQGEWQRRLDYEHNPNQRRPGFLRPEDEELLAQLLHLDQVLGSRDEALLGQLLASGRCYLAAQQQPLKLGPPRPLHARWQVRDNGSQRLHWDCPDSSLLSLFPKPWYLDPVRGLCGPTLGHLSSEQISALERHPLITPPQLAGVLAELRPLLLGVESALPQDFALQRRQGREPLPLLRISGEEGEDSLLLQLLFIYDGLLLSEPCNPCHFDGQQVTCFERDAGAEQAQLAQIADFFPSNLATPFERRLPRNQWRRKGAALLARLHRLGWRIDYAEGVKERFSFAEDWYGQIDENADGWLDLSVGVELDGQRINLVPLLCELVRSHDPLLSPEGLLQLDDAEVICIPWQGRNLVISVGRLRPLLKTLFELYLDHPQSPEFLRLSPVRAANYLLMLEQGQNDQAEPPQPGLRWREPARLQRLREQLQRKLDNPTELPVGLKVELRPYQLQGLGWLQFLQRHGIGGILADDMGLGKTLQTLAWLLWQKQQELGAASGPSLVLAPTSLLGNWKAEARKFAPELRVLLLHGPNRHAQFPLIPEQDLVITSYPLLARDQDLLAEARFQSLILDEAQAIKNPSSQTARAVRRLRCETGLCLTGTPLENHLGEFWALFDFLMPGFLGGPNLFQRLVRDPIEKQGDLDTNRRLAQRIRPFMLRRTKQEVLAELPPKTEIERCIELEDDQRELYESIRGIMHQRVQEVVASKGLGRSGITILDALLKLRQVCCDPRLVKLVQARQVKRSVKLDYLRLLLPDLIEEGRRILLFSQFTSMLDLIETEVQGLDIGYARLTGQTRDRDAQVRRFQSGQVPLFLISLKAGGTGLNLTSADSVIHYDPWWNPAVERQATDRAHRIGQDKPVFVYKLLCEGTVETRIRDLQQRKQDLADNLFEATGKAKAQWDANDLTMLFAPLEEL
ncbi:DEAD/DEAH box helicase [Magnetovirga frankeli]|uniref:DEAD/DEAH box helicase n=1 Tax=Magnetovirga frankeli TaxID=947516 RepID=UPI003D338B83